MELSALHWATKKKKLCVKNTEHQKLLTLYKKRSFVFKISLVNVTKFFFGYFVYSRDLMVAYLAVAYLVWSQLLVCC